METAVTTLAWILVVTFAMVPIAFVAAAIKVWRDK